MITGIGSRLHAAHRLLSHLVRVKEDVKTLHLIVPPLLPPSLPPCQLLQLLSRLLFDAFSAGPSPSSAPPSPRAPAHRHLR